MLHLLLLIACAPPIPNSPEPFEATVPPDRLLVSVDPTGGSAQTGLLINEIMPENDSTFMDEDQGLPDWVELYNGGVDSVDLVNLMMISGDGGGWMGGEGSIAPGEHLVLLADGQALDGHLPFTLDKDGDSLSLYLHGERIDALATGLISADVALARVPDGGAWVPTVLPSPGWANRVAGTDSTDPRDTVFQDYHVTPVDILIEPADYNTLNNGGWGGRTQVSVRLTIEGIHYPSVGMKLKGSGSYQSLGGKAAFKLDLNDYEPTARFRGLDHLTFNNGVTYDPTWTHEWLTYSLFRAVGIPAPRVGWARVTINGTDYGLYMNVETYDKELLERWFADPEGDLWEGSGDFNPGSVPNFHHESGPGDTTHLEEIADLMGEQATDANLETMSHLIDLDEFATYMATEAVTLQWDGYESPNNYRMYHEPVSSYLLWLPTGVDYTWNNSNGSVWYGNGRVYRWCLENATWRRLYDEKLIEVAQTANDVDLVATFDDLSAWLEPEYSTDPRTPHSSQTITNAQATTRRLLKTWPDDVIVDATADLQ